jgi:hypothetical protein
VPLPTNGVWVEIRGGRGAIGSGNQVYLVDASDPGAAVIAGTVEIPGGPGAAAIHGSVLYAALASGGITIVDIADPSSPATIATIGSDPFDGGVVVHDGKLLIGEGGRVSAIERHCEWIVTEARAPDRPALTAKPNPFRFDTTIRFELPVAGVVDWSVFDVRGHLVRRSEPEHVRAGSREIVWDGRDATGRTVAAGIYFVRLRSESHTATGKVVRAR